MPRSEFFRPFDIVDGDRSKGLVLLADHAGRGLPDEYGQLGLPASEFDRHIAYDIGVEPLTRRLAELTGDNPENLTLDLSCHQVFAAGRRQVATRGPFPELEEEIVKDHRNFW